MWFFNVVFVCLLTINKIYFTKNNVMPKICLWHRLQVTVGSPLGSALTMEATRMMRLWSISEKLSEAKTSAATRSKSTSGSSRQKLEWRQRLRQRRHHRRHHRSTLQVMTSRTASCAPDGPNLTWPSVWIMKCSFVVQVDVTYGSK